jgi:hypothetical protein
MILRFKSETPVAKRALANLDSKGQLGHAQSKSE